VRTGWKGLCIYTPPTTTVHPTVLHCTALHMNARSSADYRQDLPFSTPCWFRLRTEISTSEQPMLVELPLIYTEVKAHLHLRNPVNAWHNMCLKPLQVGSMGPRVVTQGDSVGREAKKIDILTCLKLISTAPVAVRSPRDSSSNNDGG
jgi:hypothetical protein